jgi:uncharacterized phiE125 gp8 family phage protein
MVAILGLGGDAAQLATLGNCIATAREAVEGLTGRAMLSATFKLVTDGWTGGEVTWCGDTMTIDRSPLTSVVSVKYYADGASTLTTMGEDDYMVITGTTPGHVVILIDPPALAERPDAVQIEFVAGSADASLVPQQLRHAVRELAAHFFENPVPVNIGNIVNEIPFSLSSLIARMRVRGGIS